MKKLLLLILFSLFVAPLQAARPTFNVEYRPGETFIQISLGTAHGLKNDFKELQGPNATRGSLKDVHGNDVGTFVTAFASDYLSVGIVDSIAEGFSIEDADYLVIPRDQLDAAVVEKIKNFRDYGYVKFQVDDSSYLYMDKGSKDIKASHFKRGIKGNLYDAEGKFAGLCTVEIIAEGESLIKVFQYNVGFFAKDIVRGHISGYIDQIIGSTGIANLTWGNIGMVLVAFFFLYFAIAKNYEPMLLVPIAFGILLGNMPMPLSIFNNVSVYMIDPVTHEYVFNTGGNSLLGMIYVGVKTGFLPPLIFMGIGALTDFSPVLSNPRALLLGAAAQVGIYAAFIGALLIGFSPQSAAAIGIIGGADGPTAIFTASRLAPTLIGPIAIAAYSYMAMVPVIQPPIMRLLTSREERLIRMAPGRKVSKFEKMAFPIGAFMLTCIIAPGGLPLLGPLFFGNLLRESGVTGRLSRTASSALLDMCTIFIGLGVGASTSAAVFLKPDSIKIFVMGCVAFSAATASGVIFAKLMNVFSKVKINPLIGAAGVSAVPDSARVVHHVGQEEDPSNFLLQHAMGPNVAGVIGSAIAAGIFLGIF